MTFRINRVYTRSGDSGDTGLVGGRRVSKTSLRVSAYGDIDETNSLIGLVKESLSKKTAELRPVIEYLQQELFDLGSELATAPEDVYEGMWQAGKPHVEYLEKLCDHFGEGLPELESFILPGGSETAALLHVARTVCRRAERTIVLLSKGEKISAEVVQYVNRLSDLLFVLARWSLRAEGKNAPLWSRHAERTRPV